MAHYQSLSWRYLGKGQLRGYATKPSKQPALTKEQKAAIVFPNEIQEIITGIILSDGSITMMGHDARLVIHQKDREFVQLIWDLFYRIGIVGAPPKERRSIIKPSGNLLFLINSLVAWASWKLARAGGGHSDARRARLSPGGCLQPPDRLAFGPGG